MYRNRLLDLLIMALFLMVVPSCPYALSAELQGQELAEVDELIETFNLLHNKRQWKHPGTLEVVATEESVLAKLRTYGQPCLEYVLQKLEKKKKKRNSQDDERALVPILQSFDRQAIEPILSAMNQGQIEIRVASWVLSGIKSLRYEELSYLLDSDSMQDRMDGINIMSSLFGRRASAPEGLRVKIAQMIALDPEEKIRRRACHTLTYYGRSEFAVKSLFENARSNSMDSIRSACLQCLCRISSESCSQEELFDLLADRIRNDLANLHLLVERELRQQEHSQGPPRYICATGPRPYDRGSEINHLIGIIAANPKLARSAIPDLRVLLNNYRNSVREAAREALSKLNA